MVLAVSKGGVFRALIPTHEPGGLNAKVYPHWKDAPVFTQVVFNHGGVREVRVHKLTSDELVINIVRREGINYVIAQSLSTRAIELLEKLGVKVILGNAATVADAISKFMEGKLYLVKLSKEPYRGVAKG